MKMALTMMKVILLSFYCVAVVIAQEDYVATNKSEMKHIQELVDLVGAFNTKEEAEAIKDEVEIKKRCDCELNISLASCNCPTNPPQPSCTCPTNPPQPSCACPTNPPQPSCVCPTNPPQQSCPCSLTPAIRGNCTAKVYTITSIDNLKSVANNLVDGLECIFWAGRSPTKIFEEKNVVDVFLKTFCPKFGHSENCLWKNQNIVSAKCDGESINKFYNILNLQNGKRVEAPVNLRIPSNLRNGEYSDKGNVELTNLCINVFDTCPYNPSGLRGKLRPDCFSPPCECEDPKNCKSDITLPLEKWSRIVGSTNNGVIFLSKVMLRTRDGFETVAFYAHESNNCEYFNQFPKNSCIALSNPFDFQYPCSGCVQKDKC